MSTPASTTIAWRHDPDGVVVLTFDDPDRPVNTLNPACRESLRVTVERLRGERDAITGVVLTSAKPTFFAGGDLHALRRSGPERAAAMSELGRALKAQLRDLETLGRPVVAAIGGAALGGGLEIALAAHHRVVVDDPAIELGLPEVGLGLLPGGGGVTRTVRLLGLIPALERVLLPGTRMTPAAALELGLVDEIVSERAELLDAAKAWIAAHPDARQPWDVPGYDIPGGRPQSPEVAIRLAALTADVRRKLKGAPYPAPHHILAAAVEGAHVDINTAALIESRYFINLATGRVAKNLIEATFFDRRRGRKRPVDDASFERAVVLGAGMMGSGIAFACASAGLSVALVDVTLDAAQRGRAQAEAMAASAVARGRCTPDEAETTLARIVATSDLAAAEGAGLAIEAVFEDPDIKAQALGELERHLAPDALIATNTSTLPITALAASVSRPEDFIGMHFFSPVDRMPLVEIVRGEHTSEATLQRALDVVALLRKTPIVVADTRGFFTSRVISTFTNEGLTLLSEGVAASSIEQASLQAGYRVGVLQLCDELNLELMRRIRRVTRQAADGDVSETIERALDVIDLMLDRHQRAGRRSGAGFYDYADGRRTDLWTGLAEAFDGGRAEVPFTDLKERLLFVEALEAVRCLDEGVIATVADANVGSVLGIGFPSWTGGVLRYVDGYRGGLTGFVDRAHELAERYGERFVPPPSLVDRAQRGAPFCEEPEPAIA
ncbi:MAG: 3-hydroxyacyl-CoA dehydrogenase / enoyl-CoA hydratase / 3-hydroxybutyryl-CoA epimerase [Solirubrobacteraceae bacterium]